MLEFNKTQLLSYHFIIIFSAFAYCQNITETINYSNRQGANQSCQFSGCTYFEDFGKIISYTSSSATNSNTTNARYLFEHPNFTNDKIKKIVLELEISKFGFSTNGSTVMQIRAPQNPCNETIPWSGFIDEEDLFYCNLFGNIVFQNGIGTTNISATTYNLLIYDEDSQVFPNSTLVYFDPNSHSLTLSFTPVVGETRIHSAKVHITYEDTSVPDTPSLSATSNSTSSINLNWTNIANATNYTVFDCDNQQITTTTTNNYTVTGLNPGISYSYKVQATNNNGASGFSNCASAITESNDPPDTPTLTAISNSISSVFLDWNTISNATSYEVFTCDNQMIATTSSNSYSVTGLNSNTTYSYKVKALNNNGASNFSNCANATTLNDTSGCSSSINNITPNLTSYAQYSNYIRFAWQSVNQADKYYIYRCETNEYLGETNLTEFFIQRESINPGESYSIKIKAVDTCINGGAYLSQFSNCSYVHSPNCISNDISYNSVNTSVSETTSIINWYHVSSCANYLYEIYNCATNEILGSTYQNTFTLNSLQSATTYSIKIRTVGCQPSDTSPFTDCFEFTTTGCMDTLVIDNEIINSSQNYAASNYIEISNSTFEPNNTIIATAENQIRILPNSHLKNGSSIILKIQECSPSNRISAIDSTTKDIEILPPLNNTILIYPNPIQDILNIKSEVKISKIKIYNRVGRLILSNTNKAHINLANVTSGLYFAIIKDKEGNNYTKKIIKK